MGSSAASLLTPPVLPRGCGSDGSSDGGTAVGPKHPTAASGPTAAAAASAPPSKRSPSSSPPPSSSSRCPILSCASLRTRSVLVLVVLLAAVVDFGDVFRNAVGFKRSLPAGVPAGSMLPRSPSLPLSVAGVVVGGSSNRSSGNASSTNRNDDGALPRNESTSTDETPPPTNPSALPADKEGEGSGNEASEPTDDDHPGGAVVASNSADDPKGLPPVDEPRGESESSVGDPANASSSATVPTPPPPSPRLLRNQTFSNWSVLAHQLPVPPETFRNEYPTGLRIAFIGDSLTRYQALSLMYYLHHGGQWQSDEEQPNMVTQKTDAYQNNWNVYFNITSYLLGQHEGKHKCDCYRGPTDPARIFENRYFRDTHHDNYVYFLTKLGRAPSRGRWWPSEVNRWKPPHSFKSKNSRAKWNYPTWDQLIRNHIAKLHPKPTHVIFNEGIWGSHDLYNNATFDQIRKALNETGMVGVYKTTTKRSLEQTPDLLPHDAVGCLKFPCLDLSWTHVLVGWPYYWDYGTHFSSHVNSLFNQQLLQMLHRERQTRQQQMKP